MSSYIPPNLLECKIFRMTIVAKVYYRICTDPCRCLQFTDIGILYIHRKGARSVECQSLHTWYWICLGENNSTLLIVCSPILSIWSSTFPWQSNWEREALVDLQIKSINRITDMHQNNRISTNIYFMASYYTPTDYMYLGQFSWNKTWWRTCKTMSLSMITYLPRVSARNINFLCESLSNGQIKI